MGGEVLGGTDFTGNPPLQEKSDVIIPIRRVSAIPSDNISCSTVPYASVEQGGLVRIPDTQTKAPQSTSPQKIYRGVSGYRVSGILTGHSGYPSYWDWDISAIEEDGLSTRLNPFTETMRLGSFLPCPPPLGSSQSRSLPKAKRRLVASQRYVRDRGGQGDQSGMVPIVNVVVILCKR